jgi:acyl-coenzyme A synthetase/AMP-(fatty) acid ligase
MNSKSAAYPLIDYPDLDRIMVYRPHARITVGRFLAEAQRLAGRLGPAAHVLNLCQDRYHFMVGLAAAILAGKISLLPSTHTDDTLRQLFGTFPDSICLHDLPDWPHVYPQIAYPVDEVEAVVDTPAPPIPLIDSARPVVYVFTSGSTGHPVPHIKTWGKLVLNSRTAAKALGIHADPVSIVGTVPPQHMFGFESTVLLCLQGRCPLWSGKPFYPADIVAALADMPEPRMLVSTPFHLESLLDSGMTVPPVAQVLLATAPLAQDLAERAEQQLNVPLREIYGCTETGQIAIRRPAESPAWALFPGITLEADYSDGEKWLYRAWGGHIEVPIALSDRLEVLVDGRFLLLGRLADQVNIAGKRSSLGFLTAQIKAIPGVTDGVFFQPEARAGQAISRLCALVVAPEMTQAEILSALRTRLDPVFLPRPLILVEALPYNDTGKLPRAQLLALLVHHRESLKR